MTAKAPTIVAITGGIGSGKSSVARFFNELGAAIVDADLLAREVVTPGSPGLAAVKELFHGQTITKQDGALDRAKVGEIVFADPEAKKALEAILHPRIRASWLTQLASLKSSGAAMIVYVVPLLFESATPMPELETIVLVTAPEHERVARIVSRDGLSEQAALGRIQSQLPDSQKIPRSHFVISNDSTLEALKQKSAEVFAMISKEARQNLPVTRKWRLS